MPRRARGRAYEWPANCPATAGYSSPVHGCKGLAQPHHMVKRFSNLYKSCRQKLERMHLEPLKTFNLISLVSLRPLNQERRTALELQRQREAIAQSEYKKCSQGLFNSLRK